MVLILNQTSYQLRNTSDPVPDSSEDGPDMLDRLAGIALTTSLGLVSFTIILALVLKHMLYSFLPNWGTHHDPEEQARSRELSSQRLRRRGVPIPFDTLPLFMALSGVSFLIACGLTILVLSITTTVVFLVLQVCMALLLFRLFQFRPPNGNAIHAWGRRIISMQCLLT